MAESTQHKLSRVRPPRVQITYDLEIGDAIEMRELPFVVGILSDLAGKPESAPPPIKDRKLVEIDRDNFNEVLASIGPRLAFQVPNRLADDDSKLNVELKFRHIDEFEPQNLVQKVEPLKKLFEARQRLNDLIAKLDGNDNLDGLLQEIAADSGDLKKIQKEAETSDADD